MTDRISSRQQQILELLLKNKTGLSIDEVAGALDISRNAVQQHFTALERSGYIRAGELHKTAGRPVRTFVLTETGINCFPKQYAWFSELMLAELKKEMGAAALRRFLYKLGNALAEKHLPQFNGKPIDKKTDALISLMDQLGYQAKVAEDSENNALYIEACNCVYHDIAQQHREICEFDKALIATLLDNEIDLVECMAEGGLHCRFKIKQG